MANAASDRFTISSFENGDLDVMHRCLAVMSAGLEDGDDYVENAVAVSFVEDTGWWEPGMEALASGFQLTIKNR